MNVSTNKVIFVMGVSGVGKSTIGKMLAKELKVSFFDGDDFHPEANITKMSNGQALNDEDRFTWLQNLNALAKKEIKKQSCVIVCSALKSSYRNILSSGIKTQTTWVHLAGSFELVLKRMQERENHFMPVALLQSQFDILENPKNAIIVDIALSPNEIIEKVMSEMNNKAEFGLFGLGVMGKSLCRNLANNGVKLSMFNRHVPNVEVDVAKQFKQEHKELENALAFDDLSGFVNSLESPRRIMLMVNAGKTIDYVIEDLLPYLNDGDVLIDGGNSNYHDTRKRVAYLKTKNIHFIGVGVSGGEEGALKGPSIMPGGDLEVYKHVGPYLEKIAAKDDDLKPCCSHIGPDGSGHFVKMIHNGVEYVEMQLLAEVVFLLKENGSNYNEIADILETWRTTEDSYLLQITVAILRKKQDGDWLLNKILDKAGNKGTGNWTTITMAELGVPATMIASALFARYISSNKDERVEISQLFRTATKNNQPIDVNDVFKAYQFARIINHYQGFKLIKEASEVYDWNLNLSELARVWTNGCIIKSMLMKDLVEVLKETDNLITHSKLVQKLNSTRDSISKVVAASVLNGIPVTCFSEAIQFFNGITTANSSANIIQAQRDYFGAHTYQMVNDETKAFYHTDWLQ